MISEPINLSTGPVGITQPVKQALAETPISHRSKSFKQLYYSTTQLLSDAFKVQRTFVLTGSGTLANEVMLQEIKALNKPGLILSNGEFGRRLIHQAKMNQLNCISYEKPWGVKFDLKEIETLLKQHTAHWILFCHCETSTGVINELQEIIALAKRNHCICFADCMSTVGTMPMDLSELSMATASSGKGLASVPGLAIVFSNMELSVKQCNVYTDLRNYEMNEGIPFTLSSNLLKALYVGASEKLQQQQYELLAGYGAQIFTTLNNYGIVPFSNKNTKVFTLVTGNTGLNGIAGSMEKEQLLLSRGSGYLKKRKWSQLALLGYYSEEQLRYVTNSLRRLLCC